MEDKVIANVLALLEGRLRNVGLKFQEQGYSPDNAIAWASASGHLPGAEWELLLHHTPGTGTLEGRLLYTPYSERTRIIGGGAFTYHLQADEATQQLVGETSTWLQSLSSVPC